MTNDERVLFGLMTMRLSDTLLSWMESWRRYASMGKFATRDDAEQRVEEARQERAWTEAALCRAEMHRREELER